MIVFCINAVDLEGPVAEDIARLRLYRERLRSLVENPLLKMSGPISFIHLNFKLKAWTLSSIALGYTTNQMHIAQSNQISKIDTEIIFVFSGRSFKRVGGDYESTNLPIAVFQCQSGPGIL